MIAIEHKFSATSVDPLFGGDFVYLFWPPVGLLVISVIPHEDGSIQFDAWPQLDLGTSWGYKHLNCSQLKEMQFTYPVRREYGRSVRRAG